jgi:hypothetical protein
MKKWRNEATRLRRKAIKNYWNGISIELNSNPRQFFKTFKPFLNSKNKTGNTEISLNILGTYKIRN